MTQPSAYYRQHHDVEAPRIDDRYFQPAPRKITPLDLLRAADAITIAQENAARDFRELYEICLAAAYMRPSIERVSGGTRSNDAGPLDARTRLSRIEAAIDEPGIWWLLVAALVEDQSWADLGRRYNIDPKTARSWVIDAIRALALAAA